MELGISYNEKKTYGKPIWQQPLEDARRIKEMTKETTSKFDIEMPCPECGYEFKFNYNPLYKAAPKLYDAVELAIRIVENLPTGQKMEYKLLYDARAEARGE